MAETLTDSEIQELYSEVSRRSAVDPEFRALALTDPIAAIAKVTDRPLPAHKTVKFVDNSKVIHVPLADPVPELSEISDFDLEHAAGGVSASSIGVGVGANWTR